MGKLVPIPRDRTTGPRDLPAPVFLYTTYYKDADPGRAAELDTALGLNATLPWIGRFVVVTEENLPEARHWPRVELVPTSRRWTFRDMFDLAARQESAAGAIHLLVNSDIVLGENVPRALALLHARSREHPGSALVLSRHEWNAHGEPTLEVGGGSADAWAWVGAAPPPGGNFFMGRFLCDGVLAHQMSSAGWLLKNPCRDVRIYHLHESNVRRHDPSAWVGGRRCGVAHTRLDDPFTNDDLYDDGWNP